ncbi:MAG: DUF3048 domain-containing protein [Candidatus Dormibacteraeota bacterium]|nr:DUF3048 domain-containing protein [Candidatus Dormibacteraeota bacterium]
MAAVLTVGAVACGSAAPAKTPTPHPSPTPSGTPTPAATPAAPPLAAPYIVQVENLNDARPQSGLSTADIVYEYETEGGISRFSAMFFSTPTATIGPVRSARLATVKLIGIYNGTLVYSGASDFVAATLADSGARAYNETSAQGALFRIGSRVAPHNLYTDGPHFAPLAQRVGPHTTTYQLWKRTAIQALPPGGTTETVFTVPVSASERPTYTYDLATGGYQRTESDTGLLVDQDTQKPWEAKNILVLPVAVTFGPEIENPPNSYGLDFALIAAGPAQLFVGGQMYPITFNESGSGPPVLTMANGQPAPVTDGQVLVELVRTGLTATPGG